MKTLAVLAAGLGWCAWACANLAADPAPATLPRAAIYQRATNEFAQAYFFKPAEPKTNDLPASLAPLILQEVKGGKRPLSRLDRFGTLTLSNGVPVLDRSRPAVYWQADSVQLHGRAHTRLSFLWCYAPPPAAPKTSGLDQTPAAQPKGVLPGKPHAGPAGLPWQGVRITLNSAGAPVIWEVLADTSGAEVIYVSQNLEAAAAAAFGKPLPGRRYAIESGLAEAPNVIVARVIDDGPVAMGPIVYLTAGTRTVTTLICRCMTAQARKLLGTSAYDLLPFQAIPGQSLLTQAGALAGAQPAFWPGGPPDGEQLQPGLRLPPAF